PLPAEETAEAVQSLEWLVANNFTFLGLRGYTLKPDNTLEPKFDTSPGVMRSRDLQEVQSVAALGAMADQVRAVFAEPRALTITKSSMRSRVHRRVYMDYVGVKRFDRSGKPMGEFRIVGLLTSSAYTRSTRSIPY